MEVLTEIGLWQDHENCKESKDNNRAHREHTQCPHLLALGREVPELSGEPLSSGRQRIRAISDPNADSLWEVLALRKASCFCRRVPREGLAHPLEPRCIVALSTPTFREEPGSTAFNQRTKRVRGADVAATGACSKNYR